MHLVFCGLLVRLEVRAGHLVVVPMVVRLVDGVQPGPPGHQLRQRQVHGAHVRAGRRRCLRVKALHFNEDYGSSSLLG